MYIYMFVGRECRGLDIVLLLGGNNRFCLIFLRFFFFFFGGGAVHVLGSCLNELICILIILE